MLRRCGRDRVNVSVIGALVVTRRRGVRAYFSLLAGASFDGEHILAFLKQLSRTAGADRAGVGPLNADRGQPVKGWLERTSISIRATLLPPYPPELNRVELTWGYAEDQSWRISPA